MKRDLIIAILFFILGGFTLGTYASSRLSVFNKTDMPIWAIWQASGCGGIYNSPSGLEYIVCSAQTIQPNQIGSYKFNWAQGARRVKVWMKYPTNAKVPSKYVNYIGYCRSMDDHSVWIQGAKGNYTGTGCVYS